MKPLFVLLFVLFVASDLALLLWFLRPAPAKLHAEPAPSGTPSSSQVQKKDHVHEETEAPQHVTTSDRTREENAPSTPAKTSDFLEDLLRYAPGSGTEKTILYTGSELLEVEGEFITEDKVTGSVFVRGLKRVRTANGGEMETFGDAILTYDPAQGNATITADSIKMTTAPPPPK